LWRITNINLVAQDEQTQRVKQIEKSKTKTVYWHYFSRVLLRGGEGGKKYFRLTLVVSQQFVLRFT
jgi:hypothetical protein